MARARAAPRRPHPLATPALTTTWGSSNAGTRELSVGLSDVFRRGGPQLAGVLIVIGIWDRSATGER